MKLDPVRRASGLAFLTAFVTLFVQVLVHRMVSVKLLNNYAFLVISLTMLGFAASGVILARYLDRFLAAREDAIAASAALFVVTLIAASSIFYGANAGLQLDFDRQSFVLSLLRWIPLSLLYAFPFAFCGLILGALLSSPDLPTRRIYFFDLVGSAAGAFAVIPAITWLGVERGVVAASGAMLVGTLLLAPPTRRYARGLAAAAAAVVLTAGALPDRVFALRYPDGSMLAGPGPVVEHVAWDPLARIEMSRIPPPNPDTWYFPSLIGENRTFLTRFKRMLSQNNYAFTFAVDYDGTKQSLEGIEQTIYSAAYHATSVARPRVMIIGVGGGFDILNALAFDASDVTAVEINGATVRILTDTYRDYFQHWVEDPRVHLVHGEGRHFLTTSEERYDVIQLSGVDSYSGTPGAAHVFSENYLYTSEAFDLYLSHLTDGGILNMMRLEYNPQREMLRALTTAVAALRRAGTTEPGRHVLMLTQPNGAFTALLVKKTPFTEAEQSRIEAWAAGSRFFEVSAGPHANDRRENPYQRFLALKEPRFEQAFLRLYPFNIYPTADDRPFFFKYSFWWHVFSKEPVVWASIPVMEYSVLLLGAIIGLATIPCVYLPLRYFAAQGRRTEGARRYGVFFAGTGVGYLAIEMALLQKFGLFLGHPNYALSVVLAALLFTTGVGSLISEALLKRLGELRFMSYLLAGVVLAEYGLVFPHLISWIGLPFWFRTAIVCGLVAPIGVCLGVFLPSALDRLKLDAPAFVPWAWGINGIFSVLAPVLSVSFSMSFGIGALLIAAVPIYMIVGWSFPASIAGSTAA